MHEHKKSFTEWEQGILSSTTRKQYNHGFNYPEMPTQVRLLECLKGEPQDKKKKKKNKNAIYVQWLYQLVATLNAPAEK